MNILWCGFGWVWHSLIVLAVLRLDDFEHFGNEYSGGLYNLVFDEDYEHTHRVFIYYTTRLNTIDVRKFTPDIF